MMKRLPEPNDHHHDMGATIAEIQPVWGSKQ
jgi:hypothetical protein